MMNKGEAIEKIWDAIDFKLDSDDVFALAVKYGPKTLHLFEMKDFNAFCDKYFHGDYMKVADYIYDAIYYEDFHQDDDFAMWNEDKKEFTSADEVATLLCDINVFTEIIEKAVANNDPILDKLGMKDIIQAIRG